MEARDPRTNGPNAPSGPQLGPREAPRRRGGTLAAVGAAGAAGVLLARLIDWRSHAHPRR